MAISVRVLGSVTVFSFGHNAKAASYTTVQPSGSVTSVRFVPAKPCSPISFKPAGKFIFSTFASQKPKLSMATRLSGKVISVASHCEKAPPQMPKQPSSTLNEVSPFTGAAHNKRLSAE